MEKERNPDSFGGIVDFYLFFFQDSFSIFFFHLRGPKATNT